MPTAVNTELPSIVDLARIQGVDGALLNIVERLALKTPVLEDAVWQTSNMPAAHRMAHRSGLPNVHWRRYNEGVPTSKSRSDTFDETMGMLEGNSAVDVKLARLGGDPLAFRAHEDKAFVQSFNHKLSQSIWYESTKGAPERVYGLSARLGSTAGTAGSQVILHDPAASGNDNCSMWLVVWGPDSVFCISPPGSPVGLEHKDMGEQLWDDDNGNKYRAYVTNWGWTFGIAVKNREQLCRIANIDLSTIDPTSSSLIDAMTDATYAVKDARDGRAAWYCNKKVGAFLHKQARSEVARGGGLSYENVGGRPLVSFHGIPIRTDDTLTMTEAAIS